MSDITIYRTPEFKMGALVDVTIQGQRLALRIVDGKQDLETGKWTYRAALYMTVDETEWDRYRRKDGAHIETIYIEDGYPISPDMLRPHVNAISPIIEHDDD